ncbi:aminotransferase-like domain-containing protein [Trichococcus ilyis]|uniref:DNA-binding transcriptional regulator, MocR family, contains an aminotransferase domain n=1 Tax=Trichococcus ilyis TaxID=640938 RepID=A0A143YFS8_9LACT|nr:PLP-dependent aminotransferase family protein [Trichococcus ilyis]CZQ87840.1 transcription regulator hth gntr [Trichococcus ilyis]SEI66395.1 DNA-binding transcriptional regulator, MocR family, contains an aminotransferase domain [Trichococcus ilyis]
MTEWRLNQDRSMPLYQQLMQLIEEKIKAGDLVPGRPLPAERKLAEALQVNRSTVIRALEELTMQGILIRKRGSGTFVNPNKWGMQTRPIINWRTSLTPENLSVDTPYQRNVKQLTAQHRSREILDLGNGDLPKDLLPELKIPDISLGEMLHGEATFIKENRGIKATRESVQKHLLDAYGMTVPLEEIFITSGTQQSLFLITQGLLKPGDAIGIEAPSYFYSLRLFQAAGLRIVPIPMDGEGMTVKGLQEASLQYPLKMIFLNPIFQNPTGTVMSPERKQAILDYCLLKRIPIVEDDAYGSFVFDETVDNRPLKCLDKRQQVLYLGSLSKFAGQHIRIGWMVGPAAIIRELADIRDQIDSGLSFLPQLLAEHYLKSEMAAHLPVIVTALKERAERLQVWLKNRYGSEICFEPVKGGFHLYCHFPNKTDTEMDALLEELLEEKVVVKEGVQFGDRKNAVRFSFGHFVERKPTAFE